MSRSSIGAIGPADPGHVAGVTKNAAMTTTKLTLTLFALCSSLTACDTADSYDRDAAFDEIDADEDVDAAIESELALEDEEEQEQDEAEREGAAEGMDMLELVLLLEVSAECPDASYVSTDLEVCEDLIVSCLPGWTNVPEECGCGCFRTGPERLDDALTIEPPVGDLAGIGGFTTPTAE